MRLNKVGNVAWRSSSSSSGSGSSAVVRRGLPHWLGVELPVISPAEAAALLEDQLWFEPFGRADAGKLLEIGCDAKVGTQAAATFVHCCWHRNE